MEYTDFSDDLNVQSKIRRAETFRSWADIEDLAHGFESLSGNFESHRTTAANAFQELYQYVEKKTNEIKEEMAKNPPARQAEASRAVSRLDSPGGSKPRIIKDSVTDQIKLEDTLIDYMEIIITLNAKMNNHINSTKISF